MYVLIHRGIIIVTNDHIINYVLFEYIACVGEV